MTKGKEKCIEYNPPFKGWGSNAMRWVENVSLGLRFKGTSSEVLRFYA